TNTATGFARLSLKTGIMSSLGDDESGERIIREMEQEKINTKLLTKLKGKNTAYSVILTGFGRDRVILHYAKAAKISEGHNANKLNSKWFYISSLHSKPELLKKIVARARKIKAKIAFNPGTQELKLGLKGLERIFGKINVLILNRQEALKLTHATDVHRNLEKISRIADNVVITDGKNGATATDGEKIYSANAYKNKTLDVTGAGDAFGSGFVGAIIKGRGIEKALEYGIVNSGSVVQYLGTKNILLSESGIKKFIKKNGKLKVKKQKL
ncbi:hypothetical protein IIC68_01185, partial [archaeon]|nr:hypothetical protein [archaeon]